MSGNKSIKKTGLTATQAKVVKAKIKADLNNLPIGAVANEAYPRQTTESARVSMSRELKNATVQEAIAAAMADAGLTANSLVDVVKDAMGSNRVVQVEGDFYETEVPDHTTRLNAARTAATWLGVGKTEGSGLTLNFINLHNNDKDAYKLS